MTRRTWILATVAGGMALAACSVRDDANQTSASTNDTATSETSVVRQETPAPTPAPTQALPAAIQTQPGPNGASVALNRVAVTGDVLTVALTYTGGTCCAYAKVDEVSVIDDATSQRLGVLKDNAGKAMAAPLSGDGKEIRVDNSDKTPLQVWFKFPAPPATTQTVSITIPGAAPFDAIPVTR